MIPVIIGFDDGLSHIRRHVIIQTNADLLSIRPQRTKSGEIIINMNIFCYENAP